jgi:hypothetical protein
MFPQSGAHLDTFLSRSFSHHSSTLLSFSRFRLSSQLNFGKGASKGLLSNLGQVSLLRPMEDVFNEEIDLLLGVDRVYDQANTALAFRYDWVADGERTDIGLEQVVAQMDILDGLCPHRDNLDKQVLLLITDTGWETQDTSLAAFLPEWVRKHLVIKVTDVVLKLLVELAKNVSYFGAPTQKLRMSDSRVLTGSACPSLKQTYAARIAATNGNVGPAVKIRPREKLINMLRTVSLPRTIAESPKESVAELLNHSTRRQ